MISTKELVGEIVTIRTIVGEELMGKLAALASNNTILELHGLRVVTLDSNGQVIMLPYTLTGNDEIIGLPTRHILSIVKSMPDAADGFREETDDTPIESGPVDMGEDAFSL